jgi:hypothetical protein
VIDDDPDVLTLRHVIYTPFGQPDAQWGLYDHGRKLVSQAAFWQGGPPHTPSQASITRLSFRDVRAEAPDQSYIYGGVIHEHYGHFLLSTYSRYWNHALLADTSRKILYHSDHDITHWLARPYVAAIMTGLGLSPERFVRFDTSVRVREIVIPAPGIEETGYAYTGFTRASNILGRRIAGAHIGAMRNTPAYLSKSRLATGVGHIVNERDFTDILASNGVEIIYPEELSFAEQVAVYYNYPVVCGATGSALHTSIFAPGRRILGLSFLNSNFSSFPMLDEANGTRSRYVYPTKDILNVSDGGPFLNSYRLLDPAGTAAEFLKALDDIMMPALPAPVPTLALNELLPGHGAVALCPVRRPRFRDLDTVATGAADALPAFDATATPNATSPGQGPVAGSPVRRPRFQDLEPVSVEAVVH